ncbi:hypothetical protein, conserved, partial [Entamoeba dispar SAW760]
TCIGCDDESGCDPILKQCISCPTEKPIQTATKLHNGDYVLTCISFENECLTISPYVNQIPTDLSTLGCSSCDNTLEKQFVNLDNNKRTTLCITKCTNSQTLDNYHCIECNTINGCISCSNSTTCIECSEGYHLSQTNEGKCYPNCEIENCDNCGIDLNTNETICLLCTKESTLIDKKICSKCSSITTNCSECYHDKYGCKLCNKGYVHSSDIGCILSEMAIPHCLNYEEQTIGCIQCENDYVLVSSTLCISCKDYFTNCLECNSTQCNVCEEMWVFDSLKQDCVYDSSSLLFISIGLIIMIIL